MIALFILINFYYSFTKLKIKGNNQQNLKMLVMICVLLTSDPLLKDKWVGCLAVPKGQQASFIFITSGKKKKFSSGLTVLCVSVMLFQLNPFAPEPPITTCADPHPFYYL